MSKVASGIRSILNKVGELVGVQVRRVAPGERNRFVWLQHMAPRSVLDVGANVGDFAVFARELLPTARIVCFEPLADCHAKLVRRMADRPRFTAYQCALGSHSAQGAVHRSGLVAASSLLPVADLTKDAVPRTACVGTEMVSVRKLDDLWPELSIESPVFMKVDVQGYELEVFRGAQAVLRHIDALLVEVSFQELYVGQPLFAEVHEFLRGAGFRFEGTVDQWRHPRDGRAMQADAVFVRRR